jgi:hypothetical protein
MPTSANPRDPQKNASGESHPADSKKFLKEFFKNPSDRPKKCDNRKVQCGLKGLSHGSDFPTVDPSSAPTGGGDSGGSGGAGVGAAASAEVPMRTRKEFVMKFRKDMNVNANQNKTAAPPAQVGSDPASLQDAFVKGAEPMMVNPSQVEVLEGPEGDEGYEQEGAEPSGCGCGAEPSGMGMSPETAMEVGDDEVEYGEPSAARMPQRMPPSTHAHAAAMRRLAEEIMAEEDALPEAEPEAMGGSSLELTLDGQEYECAPEAQEVDEDEVEYLDGGDEVKASTRRAAEQPAASDVDPSAAPSHSPSEQKAPWEKDSSKAAGNPSDAAKSVSVSAELVEVLTPIETLGEIDINDVELNLFHEDSDNPHYTVMVKGEPVAKIALADQTLPQDQHELFLQPDYPQFVLEGIEQFGLADTLQSVHARYYAAKAFEGAVAAEMKKSAAADMVGESRRHIAKVKDDLGNVAALVIEASLKNYIVENPLRDALVQQMRSAGVDADSAVDLVEEGFRQAGSQYFTMILSKAEEWMGAPKEAMAHHIKEITGMNYRHPGYAVADAEVDGEIPEAVETEEAPMISMASVPRNVPLRTMAPGMPAQASARTSSAQFTGDWQTDKNAWKQKLNLFGHVAGKSMANVDKYKK